MLTVPVGNSIAVDLLNQLPFMAASTGLACHTGKGYVSHRFTTPQNQFIEREDKHFSPRTSRMPLPTIKGKVEIAEPAKADIQEAFDWWSENRSAIQAAEWYERIFEAIATLESMPERCPRVSESGLSRLEYANCYSVSVPAQRTELFFISTSMRIL